jgi:hypothetical protein
MTPETNPPRTYLESVLARHWGQARVESNDGGLERQESSGPRFYESTKWRPLL